MSPQDLKIQELEKQVKQLTNFMLSFNSVAELSPLAQLTIQRVAGNATLAGLSDVAFTSLSNGQVVKYNSSTQKWYNGTDIDT